MVYPYNNSHYFIRNRSNGLKDLIGTNVSINLGGPEKGEGTLLKIQSDFCVLQSDDGVVYYPLHHINGFSEQSDDESEDSDNESEDSDENEQKNNQNNENETPIIIAGNRFGSIINRLVGEKVQLNRGPKKVEGIVTGRTRDHIILDVDGQITYVPMFHVQSLRWDYDNDSNENSNEKSNKNKNNDDNESSKKKRSNRCGKRRN